MRGIWERFACISRRRSTDSGRASREEKNLGGYPETKGKRLSVFLPPLQLRFAQSSALAGNRGVFAMSSHPFRVRTRNTRINMKFHRRNTGALPPSLSLEGSEGRKRPRDTGGGFAFSKKGGEKSPGLPRIEREEWRSREREERNLDSSARVSGFALASRAIDRRNIFRFEIRIV